MPRAGRGGCRRAEVLHAAVDQVADDRDQIGPGGVDGVDDLLGEPTAEHRAQVDVADHRDPVAVRRARELRQRHGDPLDPGPAQDAVRAVADGSHGGRRGGSGDDPGDEEAAGGGGDEGGAAGFRRLLCRRPALPGFLGRTPVPLRLLGRCSRRYPLRVRYGGHGGPTAPVPALEETTQQGSYDLSRHDRQQQVDRQRQPQEAGPREHPLEPEGRAGALRDQGTDRQHPAAADEHRAHAAAPAGAAGGVAEQAAPQVPVGRHEDGQGKQCEDDDHGLLTLEGRL